MGKSLFDREWIPQDLRPVLDALVAAATGTLAGILVDSGFGIRDSIIDGVLGILGPVFDLFSHFPNAQLVVANFIDRIPVVLIVGLAVGMILRQIRYRRLLLGSTLVWLAYLLGGRLAHPRIDVIPEVAGYLMQYAFLILVIRSTHALLVRTAKQRVDPEGAR